MASDSCASQPVWNSLKIIHIHIHTCTYTYIYTEQVFDNGTWLISLVVSVGIFKIYTYIHTYMYIHMHTYRLEQVLDNGIWLISLVVSVGIFKIRELRLSPHLNHLRAEPLAWKMIWYVCMYLCMYVCMYTPLSWNMTCMYVCMYVCMHACIHLRTEPLSWNIICVYVCMYHTHIHEELHMLTFRRARINNGVQIKECECLSDLAAEWACLKLVQF